MFLRRESTTGFLQLETSYSDYFLICLEQIIPVKYFEHLLWVLSEKTNK